MTSFKLILPFKIEGFDFALLIILPQGFTINELPVEEAMKSFFLNPEEFIND